MEILTMIAAAKGIAKLTGLDDWINDKVGADTAQKVVEVAQAVTGTKKPGQALKELEQDAQLAKELRGKLLEQEHEINLAILQDVQSARESYNGKAHPMADTIALQIIKQNHWLVFLLLAINGLVFWLVDDSSLAQLIGNATGFSINALWSERQQVISFFFGSSLGSKIKDGFKNLVGKGNP